MQRFPRTLRLLGLGWYIALCLVVGVGGGVWLDQQLHLKPLFLLLGLTVGLVAAFYGTYRLLVQSADEQ